MKRVLIVCGKPFLRERRTLYSKQKQIQKGYEPVKSKNEKR